MFYSVHGESTLCIHNDISTGDVLLMVVGLLCGVAWHVASLACMYVAMVKVTERD